MTRPVLTSRPFSRRSTVSLNCWNLLLAMFSRFCAHKNAGVCEHTVECSQFPRATELPLTAVPAGKTSTTMCESAHFSNKPNICGHSSTHVTSIVRQSCNCNTGLYCGAPLWPLELPPTSLPASRSLYRAAKRSLTCGSLETAPVVCEHASLGQRARRKHALSEHEHATPSPGAKRRTSR